MPVLVVTNLSKTFSTRRLLFGAKKTFTAVDSISFALEKGEILGFLGPNGAGKTTTIEMLLGTLTPSSGNITYFDKDFAKHRSEIVEHVTFASSYVKLPSRLTIHQNLDIFGRLYGIKSAEREVRIKKFLTMFNMWEMRNKPTGGLSAGQSARVMLAKAFIPYPEIILLDEPTAALDPDIAQEVRAFILKQRDDRGISVLFTSHNMDEVTQVCDRVLVLKQGKIIANNSPIELAASVANVHVHLFITDGLKRTIEYAEQQQLPFKLYERTIEIEIDEYKIADLLIALAQAGVTLFTNFNR